MTTTILQGDVLERLRELPDESVHCVVTSPPYWGLRDYGCEGQIGLEDTVGKWVARMVEVFREVRRVLRDDGTLWLNLGGAYVQGGRGGIGGSCALEGSRKSRDESKGALELVGGKLGCEGLGAKQLIGQPWRVAFALQADGWYLRSDIIWAKPNPTPESVTDRPTKSHEYLFLFAKGQWKTRVVQLADLNGECVHFLDHLGPRPPDSWGSALCVGLASAILDLAKGQEDDSLRFFDSEIWEQRADGGNGLLVGDLPVEHCAAIWAARLLQSTATTKEFMCEINRLLVALPDGDDLLKRWVPTEFANPPGVYRDGKGTVAVHHAGQICKVDFLHGTASIARPRSAVYFYDAEAIRERDVGGDHARNLTPNPEPSGGLTAPHTGLRIAAGRVGAGRNARSVWSIPTQPYPGAHFATFPPELPRRCLFAGTSERGVCPECGAPWVRVTHRTEEDQRGKGSRFDAGKTDGREGGDRTQKGPRFLKVTIGWRPTCKHYPRVDEWRLLPRKARDEIEDAYQRRIAPEQKVQRELVAGWVSRLAVPATVLDPFMGSGTTLAVALRYGRDAIGIELNPEYIALAEQRITEAERRHGTPLFAEPT